MSKYYKEEDVISFLNAHMWEYQIAALPTVEVSEDAISREWVLNRLAKYQKDYTSNELDDWQNTIVEWITTDIEDAPSVIPKEKEGEWISKHNGYWTCSECGLSFLFYAKGNYCPNCGSKMKGAEE